MINYLYFNYDSEGHAELAFHGDQEIKATLWLRFIVL